MVMELQARWTEHWEGRRNFAYDDKTGKRIQSGVPVQGKPTVGVGMNLATAAARLALDGMGINFAAVVSGELVLTDGQIDQLLAQSLGRAIGSARGLFPSFDEFPVNQQIVITDLSFNMGVGTLATFTHTGAFIRAKDWKNAAAALQDSAWFHQVGSAATQRGGANVAVLGGMAEPIDFLPHN